MIINPPICCEYDNLVVSLYFNLNYYTMIILALLCLFFVLLCFGFIQMFVIPVLSPDSKLLKWWEKHMVNEDTYDRGPR